MQVTNHSNNKRNMKEELLEAIYGTVERLEQKVDELSDSPKNTEAESTPVSVSVDTSKLEKAILAMAVKEGEAIDKLVRLREAICIFTDLTKKEASNGEQRSKVLFDTVKQLSVILFFRSSAYGTTAFTYSMVWPIMYARPPISVFSSRSTVFFLPRKLSR